MYLFADSIYSSLERISRLTIENVSIDIFPSLTISWPASRAACSISSTSSSDLNIRGKHLYIARGGGAFTIDIYDLTTGRWITTEFTSPQSEGFTAGSSYAYDGDYIYASRSTTGTVIRILRYNINTGKIDGLMTSTILQNNAHVGNLMEVVKDPTGNYKYLYILQNTGTLLARALIF